jgi:CubicO group peptidase (beta-lactamase class C family)
MSPRIRQRIWCLFTGLVGIGIIPMHADTVDDAVARLMKKREIPGLSLAVFSHGELVKVRGYGVVQELSRTPVSVDTLFQAGSISKPVSSVGLLHLVQIGKLSLDADVNRELKSWHVPENELTQENKVTLRRLLSHTAGLTVHGFGGYASGDRIPTLVQILDGLKPANSRPIRVDISPGTVFRYSGGGFVIAQQLAIDVTGQSFPDFMRSTVLEPFGMRASGFEQPLPARRSAEAASGQGVVGGWHTYPEMAAAGLWTTPSDLARFAIRLQAAYAGASNAVISSAMAHEMLTRQKPPMGLGIGLRGDGDNEFFSHDGRDEGFDASLVGYMSSAQGAVIMINANDDTGASSRIMEIIADQYGWADYPHRQRPRSIPDKNPEMTEKVRSVLEGIRQQNLDPILSTEVVDILRPRLAELSGQMREFGVLKSLQLTGSKTNGAFRTYYYFVVYQNDLLLADATFNDQNVLTELNYHNDSAGQ